MLAQKQQRKTSVAEEIGLGGKRVPEMKMVQCQKKFVGLA
jgi:hypothetical protein